MQPNDPDALWDQALLFKDQGQPAKVSDLFPPWRIISLAQLKRTHPPFQAIESFQRLLLLSPHDLNVLSELPPLFAATNTIAEGVRIYEAAFDYYTRRPYVVPSEEASSSAHVFTIDHIVNLADLMLHVHDYEGVITVVKRGQRWLQGRAVDNQWDTVPDDREFDPEGIARDDESASLAHGGFAMDVGLRHRLAIARLRLAHDVDAGVSGLVAGSWDVRCWG
jgi:general transcription factor 3C polypeptide 3 (transcription factor C subunit 4)